MSVIFGSIGLVLREAILLQNLLAFNIFQMALTVDSLNTSPQAPVSCLQYGLALAATCLPPSLLQAARRLSSSIQARSEVELPPAHRLDSDCLRTLVQLKKCRRLGLAGAELAQNVLQVWEWTAGSGAWDTAPQCTNHHSLFTAHWDMFSALVIMSGEE